MLNRLDSTRLDSIFFLYNIEVVPDYFDFDIKTASELGFIFV